MNETNEEKQFAKWVVILILSVVLTVVAAIFVMTHYPEDKQEQAPESDRQVTQISLNAAPRNVVNEIQVENTYTITATVQPFTAENKRLNWSVEFVAPNSAWAKGKTVTNYITVTPSEDTSRCRVDCKQAFGERIAVTATSESDPSITAVCYCEFLHRTGSMRVTTMSFGQASMTFDMSNEENTWTYTNYGNIYDPYNPTTNAISASELSFGCEINTTDTSTTQDGFEFTYTFEATEEYKAAMKRKGNYTFSKVTGMLDNGSIVTDIPEGFAFGAYFPLMGMNGVLDMLAEPIMFTGITTSAKKIFKDDPDMRFMKLTVVAKGSNNTYTQTTYFKANVASL